MKKMLICLLIGLGLVSLVGCGESEEMKQMKERDKAERLETEVYLITQGVSEKEIERALEIMEDEQDSTREARVQAEIELENKRVEERERHAQWLETEQNRTAAGEQAILDLLEEQIGDIKPYITLGDWGVSITITVNDEELEEAIKENRKNDEINSLKKKMKKWSQDMNEMLTSEFSDLYEGNAGYTYRVCDTIVLYVINGDVQIEYEK